MDIARILIHMGHEGRFILDGDDYAGLKWADKATAAPTEKEIAAAELGLIQADAKERVKIRHGEILETLTGKYTIQEISTWKPQADAASAHKAGRASRAQRNMLKKLAQLPGEDEDAIADKIMGKSDRYEELIGIANGFRRIVFKRIDDAKTVKAVADVLEKAEAEAMAMAKEWETQNV